MYIQITDRCNMTCEHCGFACTAEGTDMSLETFRHALDASGEGVTLGGGEPTIHPQFWQILGESISATEYVWLATNGSITTTALALAKLAKKGIIGCDLSQDEYHDRIDPEVIIAFMKEKKERWSSHEGNSSNNDLRAIRDVSGSEIEGGRCEYGEEGCFCEELVVEPDGTVRGCGCADAPILGNINDENFEIPMEWQHGECSHQQTEEIVLTSQAA